MAINYHRSMSERGPFISPRLATILLRKYFNPLITVTDVRKLYGGSVNRVLEFILDRDPKTIVAKIHDNSATVSFQAEAQSLRYYKAHTRFPVPEPLACIENDPSFDGTMLLLQKVNGTTLEGANLTPRGKDIFQQELAAAVGELHRYKRKRFGPVASEDSYGSWLDIYGPMVAKTFEMSRGLLSSSSREVVDHVQRYLDRWLNHQTQPTLIHGDLWANNILIDDGHPDQPRILAFIDSQASFADPEYELAYLQLFGTGGKAFFKAYAQIHEIAPGYKRRSRVYWLVTLLQNAARYGERYVPQCERLCQELRKFAK
eukprot:g14214.t1